MSIRRFIKAIQALPADEPRIDPKKRYRTQKEHWLGWLRKYHGPGAYGRSSTARRDAKYAYNHIVEVEMLLWLIAAAGVEPRLVSAARRSAVKATTLAQKSAMVRKHVPWAEVENALLKRIAPEAMSGQPGSLLVEPLEMARLTFDGPILRRGYWLYVWKIRCNGRLLVYVGRTGDSSSPFAASPFIRAGQHLDFRKTAKANALARQLERRGVDPVEAEYELVALGPLAPEATEESGHWPLRDKLSALEAALGRELQARGYDLIGRHGSRKPLDCYQFSRILSALEDEFPWLRPS